MPQKKSKEFVLLTGEVEFPFLRTVLLEACPDLFPDVSVVHAGDLASLEAACLDDKAGDGERCLIAFCTQVIVPGPVIESVSGRAYNFHPGPPTYPGSHAANFAVYDGAERFGVTAHIMTERVDAGPIVGVGWFPVPVESSGTELEEKTYVHLFDLFKDMATSLVSANGLLPELNIQWSGRKTTKRDYDIMKETGAGLSVEEINRRRRAFGRN